MSVAEAVLQRRRAQRANVVKHSDQPSSSSEAAPSEPVQIDSSSDDVLPANAPADEASSEGVQTRSKGLQKRCRGGTLPSLRMKDKEVHCQSMLLGTHCSAKQEKAVHVGCYTSETVIPRHKIRCFSSDKRERYTLSYHAVTSSRETKAMM